jgi:peptidoglycan/xylan/chitin deacetylase (PgdA/CDA1 family)
LLSNPNTHGSLKKGIDSLPEPGYSDLKEKIIQKFRNTEPGEFGSFVKGVKIMLKTKIKYIALTLDACGGKKGNGYNANLIVFLQKERIPATLFVTGRWIDANPKIFAELAKDTLFEIENHGLNHRVCSVTGQTIYGLTSTKNVADVVDEMEYNARKLRSLTRRRPVFFRPAGAFIDEASVQIAERLGMTVVNYSILSGDGVPFTPADTIEANIIGRVKPGGIILMHFNHPEWFEKQALEMSVPILRKMGYSFVKLRSFLITPDSF